MCKVNIKRVMPTSYEDGTWWIEYVVNDRLGYEISDCNSASHLKEDSLVNKPVIDICSDFLKNIIEECRESENEMWFVEQTDLNDFVHFDEQEQFLKELQEEVQSLGLEEYITFFEDDAVVTVYGGVITRFLF